MRVFVTGGTGFVGSHTVAALIRAGHEIRMLARDESRVEAALKYHGVDRPDVVVGDVTDPTAVAEGMEGCDAVVHGANIFTFDPAHADTMHKVNTEGTELVLGLAASRGLDPIVHISSFVALIPSDVPLTEESPIGSPEPEYSKSKASAERIARRYQDSGAPVVITYPGSVWGPGDPYLGETSKLASNALRGKFRLLNDGLLPVSDARDVAVAHASVMEQGKGPRRFILVGHTPQFRLAIARLGELSGRNLWSLQVPHWAALGAGRAADWARKHLPVDPALAYEAPWLVANGNSIATSLAVDELGITYTSLDKSFIDTVQWLLTTDRIPSKAAPALAV